MDNLSSNKSQNNTTALGQCSDAPIEIIKLLISAGADVNAVSISFKSS